MRVLITGGFGFVGGRLAQHLASDAGDEVILGSRREWAPPGWLPWAKTVQTRWESQQALEVICVGVDAIVHLAGMNARDCASDPVAALEFNGLATSRLMRAAVRRGVGKFLYVSTAHVYGEPLAGTITELTCAVPSHPYATSHRAGEDAVRAAGRAGEIEGLVLRLSNAFGAPARKEADCWMLLINDLCRQAVTTRRMVLRSSGLQRRDFVPLAEACRAIGHFLRMPSKTAPGDVFNVGGGVSMTVWDVACLVGERCQAVLGFRPELQRVAPAPGEVSAALDYRIDLLRESGFDPGADPADEIDRLLAFCASSFS